MKNIHKYDGSALNVKKRFWFKKSKKSNKKYKNNLRNIFNAHKDDVQVYPYIE